jgi:hypothetical protein
LSNQEEKKRKNVVFDWTRRYNNAVLNFMHNPEGEFMLYGDTYHRAAKQLLEIAISGRGSDSLETCPIVFLYRQALELHLKSIIINGNNILRLEGKEETAGQDIFTDHSLTRLLAAAEPIIEFMGWKEGGFEKDCIENFEDCKTVIRDFNAIDPGSYAFRYPVDKRGQGSVEHHFAFDVRRLAAILNPVLELLSGAAYALDDAYDNLQQAYGEAQQEAMANAEYDYEPPEVNYGDYERE